MSAERGMEEWYIDLDLKTGNVTHHNTPTRTTFPSGMQRDAAGEKVRWDLVYDGPILLRYAQLLTRGAKRYAPRNWMKACSEEELERAKESAARHFADWMQGRATDEDNAAAVVFNINLAEYIRGRLNAG